MSLIKRYEEILLSGFEQDKYQVCCILVRRAVKYNLKPDTCLKVKRKYYEDRVHFYADKYRLSRSKLGKLIAGGEDS